MPLKQTLLIILTGITVLAAVLAAAVLRGMFLPTRGKRIGVYPEPKKALLVLDVQEGSSGPARGRSFETMITTINRLVEQFSASGMEVAYVRQVFSNNLIVRLHGGRILSERMEPRLDRRLLVVNDNDFSKNRTDAFASKRLEQFLIDRQVDEVCLVGVDAAFCVYSTARGALNRGYRVTVVKDAVLSRRPLAEVFARYAARGIPVATAADLLEQQ